MVDNYGNENKKKVVKDEFSVDCPTNESPDDNGKNAGRQKW